MTYHVYPVGDLLGHDTDDGDCACLPLIEPVERDDVAILRAERRGRRTP